MEPQVEEKENFRIDMTIGEAMRMHPHARHVFASFHLGGCAHCAVSEEETIAQVCEGYGVPEEMLLSALNALLEEEDAEEVEQ